MWVITTEGFFSAVASDDNTTDVVVRTRHRGDLAALNNRLMKVGFTAGKVLAYQHSDYPWRVVISKDAWAAYLSDQAQDIDYRNFKNEVTRKQGNARHDIYSRIWGVLLSVEKLPGAMREHGKVVKRTPVRPSRWGTIPLTLNGSWWDDRDWDKPKGSLSERLAAEDPDLPDPDQYDLGIYDPTSPFYVGPCS